LSLTTKFQTVLGLAGLVLGPGLSLEGFVLAEDYTVTVSTDTYRDFVIM